MKIVHVSLASSFNLEMSYQENQFIENHVKNKIDVTLITTCYKFLDNDLIKVPEEKTQINKYFKLIRLKYRFAFLDFISSKLRMVKDLKQILEEENPDMIYHHSLQTFEMITISRYCRINGIPFIVDSHEDIHNSARNFLSRFVLHKIYYKFLIKLVYKYISKIYYVSVESRDFLVNTYNLSTEKMEFLPLGGDPVGEELYSKIRDKIRRELNISDKLVFTHSGKFDEKKRTLEIIESFSRIKDDDFVLIISGVFEKRILKDAQSMIIKDSRIKFLGWKSSGELKEILMASDVYLQPGSQSATMQVAVCLRTALALYPYVNYKNLFTEDEIWFIKTKNDLDELFQKISNEKKLVFDLRKKSYQKALSILDNSMITNKFTSLFKEEPI